MAASFLRPLLPPKPFLLTPKPQVIVPITPTTAVRCTAAPKPTTITTPNPKPTQQQGEEQSSIPDEREPADPEVDANANPHRIPDDETPPSAAATTSFSVVRRVPSAISTDGRLRRTALTQEEPPNFEIGWKRTKELPPLEKPKGWIVADFMEKLEGLMQRGRYGSGALLGTVAGVVTERAREEAEILVAEGGVDERVATELFRVLRLVEMDVEMVKAAVKEDTVKERVETARARCRQAILVALSL